MTKTYRLLLFLLMGVCGCPRLSKSAGRRRFGFCGLEVRGGLVVLGRPFWPRRSARPPPPPPGLLEGEVDPLVREILFGLISIRHEDSLCSGSTFIDFPRYRG